MNSSSDLPVWDIWVRLFHWSLAVSVILLLYSGETGELFFDWHRLLGEFVLLLVMFRLLWGIVGSSNTRLSRLFRNPLDAMRHLRALITRQVSVEREHNAAGSLAVLAILLLLGVQAVTGMFIADEDEFVEGALYGQLGRSLTNQLYDIHMMNADLIQIIVIVHVCMIAAYFVLARINLVKPMITGKVSWPDKKAVPELQLQKWWVGLISFAVCTALVAALAGWVQLPG